MKPSLAFALTYTTLDTTSALFFIALFPIAGAKYLIDLSITNRMELEADSNIPQHYSHYYAYTLTKLSEQTAHTQTKLSRFLYSLIDAHPPLNARINATVDINLPDPIDTEPNTIFTQTNYLLSLLIPVSVTIGLLAYFDTPKYAIASGIAAILFSLIVLTKTLQTRFTNNFIPAKERNINIVLLFIPLYIYILTVLLTSTPLLPNPLTISTATTHFLTTVGVFVNSLVLVAILFKMVSLLISIPLIIRTDPEKITTEHIHNDSHKEELIRDYYEEQNTTEQS